MFSAPQVLSAGRRAARVANSARPPSLPIPVECSASADTAATSFRVRGDHLRSARSARTRRSATGVGIPAPITGRCSFAAFTSAATSASGISRRGLVGAASARASARSLATCQRRALRLLTRIRRRHAAGIEGLGGVEHLGGVAPLDERFKVHGSTGIAIAGVGEQGANVLSLKEFSCDGEGVSPVVPPVSLDCLPPLAELGHRRPDPCSRAGGDGLDLDPLLHEGPR